MDITSLLKQQIETQRLLYSQRLEDIVMTIKQAAQQSLNKTEEQQFEYLKTALFNEREVTIQRLVDQISQVTAELTQKNKLLSQYQQKLEEKEKSYQKVKNAYTRVKNEQQSRGSIASPTEQEFRLKMQVLEQQLITKEAELKHYKKEQNTPKIGKEEHESMVAQLQARHATELTNFKQILDQQHFSEIQKLQFDHEKQTNRLRLSFDKKIHQLNNQINELKFNIQTHSSNQNDNNQLKLDFQDKMKQIENLQNEILKEKQKYQDVTMANKQLKISNEQLIKNVKQFRKELNEISDDLVKTKQMKPLMFNLDEINNCLQNMQRKMINPTTVKSIAQCFHEIVKKKQETFKIQADELLQEFEQEK